MTDLAALVLRKTPYRDHDLIVDLLTESAGRMAVLARGARRSRKRFGGALEIGTGLDVQLTRSNRGPVSLGSCDVRRALNQTRTDLDRIAHLSYVLEIARLTSREGEADPAHFGMVDGYLAALEAGPAQAEALVIWQIALLSHLGYALRLGPCVQTGSIADALSPRFGGAINSQRVSTPDALLVTPAGIDALVRLSRGDTDVRFEPDYAGRIQHAFAALWQVVGGQPLRTAAFLPAPSKSMLG
jgi:DNA repair protein RecO (recombination protein O)